MFFIVARVRHDPGASAATSRFALRVRSDAALDYFPHSSLTICRVGINMLNEYIYAIDEFKELILCEPKVRIVARVATAFVWRQVVGTKYSSTDPGLARCHILPLR